MCSVRLAANGSQFLPKVTYLPLKSRSELFVPGRTSVSSISHAAASMMAPALGRDGGLAEEPASFEDAKRCQCRVVQQVFGVLLDVIGDEAQVISFLLVLLLLLHGCSLWVLM